jgi:hypothetical protein
MFAFLPHGLEWFMLVPVAFACAFVLNLVTGEISTPSKVISRKETPDDYWDRMAIGAFFTIILFLVAVWSILGR